MPHDINIQIADFQAFLAQLQDNSADLILTDPPYTISRQTGFKNLGQRSVKRLAVGMDFGAWDRSLIDLDALCQQSYRVLRQGGTIIVFYDLWKITVLAEALTGANFKQLRFIEWLKMNPVPLNSRSNYLSNSREIAVLAVKGGKPTFHSTYDNGVYRLPIHREKRYHPTQKPLKLIRALIEKHSHPNDLIVDPFLGAGTTAVAAVQTGRRFCGCDIDTEYVKAAEQRVLNCTREKSNVSKIGEVTNLASK